MNTKHDYPESLSQLIKGFSRLPGIGRRTAERLVFSLLEWPQSDLTEFGERLGRIKELITSCNICGNLAEEEVCSICRDSQRDSSLICVVESPAQIMVIERAGCFNGLYHVLGGRIAPLDGKGPEDLRIKELIDRVKDENVQELILATGADVEGEATANYIRETVHRSNLRITRIAFGIPVGADIGFADSATVAMAISSRHPAE